MTAAATLTGMIGYLIAGIAATAVGIAILRHYVKPARAVCRGEAPAPVVFQNLVEVAPRTYLTFLLCLGALTLGIALGGIGVALAGFGGMIDLNTSWARYLIVAGLAVAFTNVVLVPLNWLVHATNRPRFLVPPAFRDQPGSIARARQTRGRTRAGLPETDHLVEIFDVRPPAGEDYPPYFMAFCADPECGWMEFADKDVAASTEAASEEQQVRRKASRHSTQVAEETRRSP